jgi:hypothetical protein
MLLDEIKNDLLRDQENCFKQIKTGLTNNAKEIDIC